MAHRRVADPDQRAARGRQARAATPRSSHGEWTPGPDRPDPVAVLQEQAETRVPDLVPVRHQRMLVSPFTFYRGAAAIMAADLADSPTSGIRVQCCGDAHLANFGGYDSPERNLVFDVNDFDETLPGPWEWDVKRLAASLVIACRDREFDDAEAKQTVAAATSSYRTTMRTFASQRDLDVWYSRLDVDAIMAQWSGQLSASESKRVERNIAKGRSKDNLRALAKLTERVDGELRIVSDPPLLIPLREMLGGSDLDQMERQMHEWFATYRRTLPRDRRVLVERYQVMDFARKVVGVGSVGTQCWIVFLLGRDEEDPLFLQIKEAQHSVLEPYVAKSEFPHHGRRVVEGQRLMQASSDTFLGVGKAQSLTGNDIYFYVRQLWDGKISADLSRITPDFLRIYAQMCGWALARAHARSGDRIAIGSYLGNGSVFDRAMTDFAFAYAAQNELDYAAAHAAADEGRIPIAAAPG